MFCAIFAAKNNTNKKYIQWNHQMKIIIIFAALKKAKP